MSYHIRRIAAGEWRQLRAIRLEALQDSPTAFSTPLAEATALCDSVWQRDAAREADSASSATFVATGEAGDWVGTAAVAPLAEVSDHAHVYAVYVTPAHRGPAGPAAALMTAAIRFARDHIDAAWLTLGVHEDNPRARAFYRKLGFAETGKAIPFALNPSQTVHIMGYQGFRSARR
ncbi:N-acetyltransferase [Micromonospora sp. MA102]|uniref:GNAT family N-acetyltransferase n=1 Tax=Micromonospora sp. MA102 TaxID=2952755 RepID=UPI0021C5BF7B|nr:GNAT family N-acetyltransferase [Micromonospora sp. MA102]